MGHIHMTMSGTTGVAATPDQNNPTDPSEEQIRALRRDLDGARREIRILKIAVAELERISERDTLTPLYNRRYFVTTLHQRIAGAEQDGAECAVIYADVNRLKMINDCYGHAAGDFALIEIAKRLQAAARPGDVVSRIGGDEFGLILGQTSIEQARWQTEKLSRLLSSEPVLFDDRAISLSACFGVAAILPGMTEADILAAADRDMYRSKANDRIIRSHR
jgi:diguanylate cyclase (GGDEF)-like protein